MSEKIDDWKKITKEELYDLYHNQKMSIYEIAMKYKIGPEAVRRKMMKMGIERRKTSYPPDFQEKDRPSVEELKKLYVHDKLSIPQIASLYDVSRSAVQKWLHSAGIRVRSIAEARNVSNILEFSLDNLKPISYKKVPRENISIPLPLKALKEDKFGEATLTLVISDLHLGHSDFLPETFYSAVETLKIILKYLVSKFKVEGLDIILNGDIVSGREVYEFQELSNLLPRGHWQVFLAEIILKELFEELEKIVKINTIYLIKGTHESLAENYLLYLKRTLVGNGYNTIYCSKGLVLDIAKPIGHYNVYFTHGSGTSDYFPVSLVMIRDLWKVFNQYKLANIPVERGCLAHTHWLSTNLELEGLTLDVTGGFQRWEKKQSQRPCGFILYLYSNGECSAIPVKPNIEVETREKLDHALEYKNIQLYGSLLLKHAHKIEGIKE